MGKHLVPFKYVKKITIVYIHGFMGDDETFYDFPEFLKNTLELYKVKVFNNPYPAFETRGDFNKSVNKFIEWLYENGGHDPIILMGHSMGGILILEAFKQISYRQKQKNNIYGINEPRIIGLFGFDSPYFGLSVNSVANAGMRRIEEPISSAMNYVTSFFGNKNKGLLEGPKDGNKGLIEDSKDNSSENTEENNKDNNNKGDSKDNSQNNSQDNTAMNSNEKINSKKNNDNIKDNKNDSKDIIKNGNTSTDVSKNNNKSNPNPNNGNSSLYWNLLGIGTAVVAGAAAIYSTIINKDARDSVFFNGQQILTAGSKYLMTYGQFLEPLVGVGNQYQSIDYLIENNVPFKNYYPITKIKNGEETTQLTFISLPTEEKYLKLFDSVPGAENATDTIYSHINMFNVETNSFNVFHLLDKCIQDIYNILRII